jgi:hypothetical protein
MSNYNHGHLDANGYRWYGEMLGKVYRRTVLEGGRFDPLQPCALFRDADDARKIRIRFLVPVGPLVLDTLTLPKVADFGFLIYQNRAVRKIAEVRLLDGVTVEITCEGVLDVNSDIEVTYAGQNAVGQGNLRDSDDYRALFNYVDIDARDGAGNFVYPRAGNRSLRPAYEPRDGEGRVFYNRPFPLFNFCVGFYYRLPWGVFEVEVATGLGDISNGVAGVSVVRTAGGFRIVGGLAGVPRVRIFGVSGLLVRDFGVGWRSVYSVEGLPRGVYVFSVVDELNGGGVAEKIVI